MKDKIKVILFSIILTILKTLLFVPLRVTGGLAGINQITYRPIFGINKYWCESHVDGFCYEFLISRCIIESIIIFIISFLIIFFIYNFLRKKDNNEKINR